MIIKEFKNGEIQLILEAIKMRIKDFDTLILTDEQIEWSEKKYGRKPCTKEERNRYIKRKKEYQMFYEKLTERILIESDKSDN